MVLCDVNVFVYAFRIDSPKHDACRTWLVERLAGPENFAYSELVLSSVVRVVTHPRIFHQPSTLEAAFGFIEAVRTAPTALPVVPGRRHWDIYRKLCVESEARGNLSADAYLAALAIEHGCEWISTDRGFARFPQLKWRVPG
ncbi:MAG: type II toxin-antitoxin system VapC family toxin [Gemmatimonadales bacterium]